MEEDNVLYHGFPPGMEPEWWIRASSYLAQIQQYNPQQSPQEIRMLEAIERCMMGSDFCTPGSESPIHTCIRRLFDATDRGKRLCIDATAWWVVHTVLLKYNLVEKGMTDFCFFIDPSVNWSDKNAKRETNCFAIPLTYEGLKKNLKPYDREFWQYDFSEAKTRFKLKQRPPFEGKRAIALRFIEILKEEGLIEK